MLLVQCSAGHANGDPMAAAMPAAASGTGANPKRNANSNSNILSAMAALLGRRAVPTAQPVDIGESVPPTGLTAPTQVYVAAAPGTPALPAADAAPAPRPSNGWQPATQSHGPFQPVGSMMHPVAAVPLPWDAFTGGDGGGGGCVTKIPRGLQCGGTGGLCAQHGGAPDAAACKDEPYVDACCASGTMCVRKSEELWVCAPGHGFLRRLMA